MATTRLAVGPARPLSAAPVRWYRRTGLWATLAALAVALLAPSIAYGWYQYEHDSRVFRGTGALGVDLGGMTRPEVERALTTRAAALTSRPTVLRAAEQEWRTDWGSLGLRLATAPLVDQAMAVGREGNMFRRFRTQVTALGSGFVIPAEQSFDEVTLRQFIQDAAGKVDRPVREARVELKPDLTVDLTSAQIGRRLDVDGSVQRVLASVNEAADAVELPVAMIQPTTTDQMRVPAKERAERIVASPITLTYGDRRWSIERQELAELVLFKGGPGAPLEVQLDTDALMPRLQAIAADVAEAPEDAKLDWNGGSPRAISPSRDGRELDPVAVQQLVSEKAPTAERTIPLPVRVAKPAVDASRIDQMGLREQIDSATTSYAGSVPEKAHNIKLAASRLQGVVVPPKALFSFNEALGPTTIANGYQTGFAITTVGDQHRTVPTVAGGICQVATTLFQPVFWSGYQIEERNWHLYWIPAYTSRDKVGLDATVDEDYDLDLQFFNNTDSHLLIQAHADDDSVTFELYGTKPPWTVQVDGPTIADQTPPDPTPVVEQAPSLPDGQRIVVEAPREGFTATFLRTVVEGGSPRTLKLESKYVPSRNVTLVGTGGRPVDPNRANELNRPVPAQTGRR